MLRNIYIQIDLYLWFAIVNKASNADKVVAKKTTKPFLNKNREND